MENLIFAISVIAGVVLSGGFAGLVTYFYMAKKLSVLSESLISFEQKNTALSIELARVGQAMVSTEQNNKRYENENIQALKKVDELQERLSSINAEYLSLQKVQSERDEQHRNQIKQFEENKELLKKEFENISNKIFEEKGKSFSTTNQASLDAVLKPFKEQLEGFQKRVNDIHDGAVKGNAALEQELKKVMEIGLKMQDEANNLARALKGDAKQRGGWGEAQLERTLEMSGLVSGVHYEDQETYKDEQGKSKRTDFVILLPNKKHIVIDSKVSLVDYEKSVSAESDEESALHMANHIKAVRKHIDDLASKEYTNLKGIDSPSFILMFMPIEPAYIEALKHDVQLFRDAYQKKVVLVSHTTLIPILTTVANLWRVQESNEQARQLGEKATDIFNKVVSVAERLKRLGGTLGTAAGQYNEVVVGLAGQQGLYGKVARFQYLSSKVTKNMPQLDSLHIDVDSEKIDHLLEAKPLLEDMGDAEIESVEDDSTN